MGWLDKLENFTAKDVAQQSGKTIMITGGNTGLGFAAAGVLVAKGAHVVIATRNADNAQKAVQELKAKYGQSAKVDPLVVDLASFKSVKEGADKYKQQGWPLHVLVNNASVAAPEGQIGQHTEEGLEITMATNHFGPFLFTHYLMDTLKATPHSRIVWQASGGESIGKVPWDDLGGEKQHDSNLLTYANTKLMNIMTANEMAKRLGPTGIKCFSCQPGISKSSIYGKADTSKPDVKAIDINQKAQGLSEEHGCVPLLFTATSPDLDGKDEAYIGPAYATGPIHSNMGLSKDREPKTKDATDAQAQHRLYNESVSYLAAKGFPVTPLPTQASAT